MKGNNAVIPAVIAFAGCAGFALLLLPPIQSFIIAFGENHVVHRTLTHQVWTGRFIQLGITGELFCVTVFILLRIKLEIINDERFYSIAGIVVIISFLALSITLAAINSAIWNDEALALIYEQGTFTELIDVLRYDSHPPFHFLLLRLWAALFGRGIFSMKLVSVIPSVLTLLCGFLFLKKEVSAKSACTFALCCAASHAVIFYGIEIRNYSWALFFVTMSAISAWYIISTAKTAPFIAFLVFALGAAYTHYYAAAMVFIGYIFLLVFAVRHDRTKLPKTLALIPSAILLYLPWLPIMIKSYFLMKQYGLTTWYEKPGIRDIISYIEFLFDTGFAPLSAAIFLLFCLSLFRFFFVKNKTMRDYFAAASLACPVILAVIMILVSVLYQPMLVDRYLFPGIGLLWLFFTAAIGRMKIKSRFVFALLAFCVFVNAFTQVRDEYVENKDFNKFYSYLQENLRENDVLIISPSEEHLFTISEYLFPGHQAVFTLQSAVNPKEKAISKISGMNWFSYNDAAGSGFFDGKTGWVIVGDRDTLPPGTDARFCGDFGWGIYKFKLYQTANFAPFSAW